MMLVPRSATMASEVVYESYCQCSGRKGGWGWLSDDLLYPSHTVSEGLRPYTALHLYNGFVMWAFLLCQGGDPCKAKWDAADDRSWPGTHPHDQELRGHHIGAKHTVAAYSIILTSDEKPDGEPP